MFCAFKANYSLMPSDLIANPYLQFQPFTNADSEIVLTAPKPGEGLIEFTISQAQYPNIFEVFADLSQSHFSFLEADKDLSKAEYELLLQKGVLVNKNAKPQKPLFACYLEDVSEFTGELDRSDLIVNPRLNFEELNLSNAASRSQQYHLSPFNSVAWVTDTVLQTRRGYWLTPEDSELVSKFEASAPVGGSVSDILARRLISAGILGNRKAFAANPKHWESTITNAKERFGSDKYVVIEKVFPPEQMSAMRRYYRQYVDQGFMPFGDNQVKRRFRQHNEPFASFLHGQLAKLVEMIVGEPIKPSYVFAASYKEGAELAPRTDREQCEYSISFQVDYEPEPPAHLSPWALCIESLPTELKAEDHAIHFTLEELERERKVSPKEIYLRSGDGLIYKGRELIHYRHELPAGHRSTSLFFHFVAADFPGSLL